MRIVFLSDRTDSHASRFAEALRAQFQQFTPIVLSADAVGTPAAEIGGKTRRGWQEISDALDYLYDIILSGPLDTVTSKLTLQVRHHIGISWATDVMVSAAGNKYELQILQRTIAGLTSVVTDNFATENALIAAGMAPASVLRFSWGPSSPSEQTQLNRTKWGLPTAGKIGLFARSISAHYRPEIFIEAAGRLKREKLEITWCFIDRGQDVSAVKQEVQKLDLADSVVWLPSLPEPQFNQLVSSVDVVVSTAATDGTSVTLRQAMHSRVPVVTSLTHGSSEWFMDGITGWTFSVGDAKGLANCLRDCLTSSEYRLRQITQNAKRLSDQHGGWERGIEKLFRLIETLDTQNKQNPVKSG